MRTEAKRVTQVGTGPAHSHEWEKPSQEDFWWLLMQVGTLSRRVTERRLAASSTSPDQVQALRAIGARDQMTVGELARALGLERNSASQLAERLVQQHLIERVRSTGDRRKVFVALSDDGKARLKASGPDSGDLASEVLADLRPEEIAASAHVLAAIRDRAGEVLRGAASA